MPHRAHISDFDAVAGSAGGANAAANDNAIAAAIASATKLIEFDADVYEISQPVCIDQHAKALHGIDGCDGFNSPTGEGTRLEWWGAAGLPVVKIGPRGTDDLLAAQFKGFQILGRGLVSNGVVVRCTRRLKLDGISVVGFAGQGFYFAQAPAGHLGVGENMLGDFANLSATAANGGTGFMVDRMSQCTLRNLVMVHEAGVAFYLRRCDTLCFINASAARREGFTGLSVMFDGLEAPNYVMGNRFFGLHCGAHPAGSPVTIYSRGAYARQNRIYGLDGVDNQPTVTVVQGSELYYDYQGGGYVSTLIAEKALDCMPKQLIRSY